MDFNEFKSYTDEKKIAYLNFWKHNKDLDNLIMSFEETNYEISGIASEIIAYIGKTAIPKLIKATKSSNADKRSWAVVTLGQIENIGPLTYLILLKLALTDKHLVVREKSLYVLQGASSYVIKHSQRAFEIVFFYIFIAIVQMVALIFLVAPLIIIISNHLGVSNSIVKEVISIVTLATIIPFFSGFGASFLFKLKGSNFPLAALCGVLQIIPYNFLVAFLIQKISLINCFVPIFGIIGGLMGHKIFMKDYESYSTYEEAEDMSRNEEKNSFLVLIFQHLQISKKWQDISILCSSFIGIIVLIFICLSIYNLSSISKNDFLNFQKHHNSNQANESSIFKER